MNVSYRIEVNLCILQMAGSINSDNIDEVSAYVMPHLQEEILEGVIMNFSKTTVMDSSGIGFIIACYHTLNRQGVPLVLCNLNRYHQIFSMMGLDKSFPIFESEKDAIQSLTKPS